MPPARLHLPPPGRDLALTPRPFLPAAQGMRRARGRRAPGSPRSASAPAGLPLAAPPSLPPAAFPHSPPRPLRPPARPPQRAPRRSLAAPGPPGRPGPPTSSPAPRDRGPASPRSPRSSASPGRTTSGPRELRPVSGAGSLPRAHRLPSPRPRTVLTNRKPRRQPRPIGSPVAGPRGREVRAGSGERRGRGGRG